MLSRPPWCELISQASRQMILSSRRNSFCVTHSIIFGPYLLRAASRYRSRYTHRFVARSARCAACRACSAACCCSCSFWRRACSAPLRMSSSMLIPVSFTSSQQRREVTNAMAVLLGPADDAPAIAARLACRPGHTDPTWTLRPALGALSWTAITPRRLGPAGRWVPRHAARRGLFRSRASLSRCSLDSGGARATSSVM